MLLPFLIERPWKKYAATLRTGTGPAMSAARDVPRPARNRLSSG